MRKKRMWQFVSLIFVVLLSLSGCGSTSSKDGERPGSTIGSMTAADVQKNQIVTEVYGTEFSLNLPFTKKVDSDFRVELTNFSLEVEGCYIDTITFSPETLILDGEKGIQKVLNISGKFNQKCTVRGYTLFAKQTIVNLADKTERTGNVSVSFDYGTPTAGFEFINVPYQLEITQYERYKIDFQLVYHGKEYPPGVVEGVQVTVKPFPNQYGTVASHYGGTTTLPTEQSSQSTITDADGVGRFIYTPPSVFPSAGTTYDLELLASLEIEDGNETKIITVSQKIQLRFNLKPGASSGQATTLSIVFGYRPPKDGQTPPSTTADNPGTGDFHETAEWDQEGSKIINYYAVHAVNEDGNRPVIGVPITMSLISNVKEFGDEKLQVGSGTISGGTPVKFTDTTINFLSGTQSVEKRDKLIVIPSEGKTDSSYLGGWNIDEVGEHTLNLSGIYSNIKDEKGLTYLIGNERRLLGRNIVVADVQAIDLESITDEFGMAYFKVTYDPELIGHTITLEAHTQNDVRVGVSRIVKPVANNSIMEYIGKGKSVENSGADEETTIRLYLRVDTSIYRNIPPDSDTAALYPIVDLDIDPDSFSMDANSSLNCKIDEDKSDFHVSEDGVVKLVIKTDGNTTDTGGVDKCLPIWNGSEEALGYDYEY